MTGPSVFISYSHKDEDWKPEIEEAINKASVAILVIYAKLLIAILFHWTILSDFWKHPNRSLAKAFKAFQRYVTPILFGLKNQEILDNFLSSLNRCYAKSCRVNKHAGLTCTFQALLDPEKVLC